MVGALALAIFPQFAAAQPPCTAPPQVVATVPGDGATRVPANITLEVIFDRPTGKHAIYSIADLDPSAGGGLISTLPDRWSPLGDTLYITPASPLPFGHLFGWKLNLVQAADTSECNDFFYPQIYYFTTASQAMVERVQAGNVSVALTPDVPMPVGIPVRELAGTDVRFTSARVQFLPSPDVTNTGPTPLDSSVSPIYEYTIPISVLLARFGAANLTVPVTLPDAIARTVPQGILGLRLTFYGIDETGSAVALDAVFRIDPATIQVHQAAIVPAMASDLLVRSATLEWPLHGAAIAAGDTVLPRAVVTGNGTGAFRAGFYLDGDLISMEEGFMEAGRPVEVTMRGPLPLRRLGEHRIQFQVESPQAVAANPISILCTPPVHGLEPPAPGKTVSPPPEPSGAIGRVERLQGALSWIAEGTSHFRTEPASAVGWASWLGGYQLSATRKLSAELSMRLRFDDVGNGRGAPQRMLVRYDAPSLAAQWGDAAPERATETPLLLSPVPRRSAQGAWRRSPLGDLDAYVALESHPVSSGGPIREAQSDLYAARLTRAFAGGRLRATAYGGYTHEDPTPGGVETQVRRRVIYGGLARLGFARRWQLLADAATVHHRAAEGVEEGRSRTGWRGELTGTAAGFDALAQAFSYQPSMETALNPYALSDRRGGFAQLQRSIWNWRFFGSFRSEEPTERRGLEPVVRVQRATIGGRLALNQDSWVSPSLVRVAHRGANTELTENRIATEFSTSEAMGGRTTARFDVGFFEDPKGMNAKRRVLAGSLVSTRKHPGRIVSTLTLGIEKNRMSDLNLTNTTIQGSFEARWEAVAGRFLVLPFLSGVSRNFDLFGVREDRYAARLQLAWLKVPGLGENALAVEGRLDRVRHLTPAAPSDLDASAKVTLGQRFDFP